MKRTDNGKSAAEVQNPKPVLENDESSDDEEQKDVKMNKDVSFDDLMSEDESVDDVSQDSDYNENENVKSKPENVKKSRIFYCMDERLFEQYCTFTSEVCVN